LKKFDFIAKTRRQESKRREEDEERLRESKNGLARARMRAS
jgi:hypothetical protein